MASGWIGEDVWRVYVCQACGYLVQVPRRQGPYAMGWLLSLYFIGREAVHRECRQSANLCPCCEGLRFCEVCTASVVYSFLRADVGLRWWACSDCQRVAGATEPERVDIIRTFAAWRKVAVSFPDFLGKPLIEPWREYGLTWDAVAVLRSQTFDGEHRQKLREVLGGIKMASALQVK